MPDDIPTNRISCPMASMGEKRSIYCCGDTCEVFTCVPLRMAL